MTRYENWTPYAGGSSIILAFATAASLFLPQKKIEDKHIQGEIA